MTNLLQQRALTQEDSHHTKRSFPGRVDGFSSKSTSQRATRLLRGAELAERPDLCKNGAEQSPCCYDDDYNDEESLGSANTVSVYGNPLWADDQNPYHSKGNNEIGTLVNAHDADVYENCKASAGEEHGTLSLLPQSDRIVFTSDSSDGEDAKPLKNKLESAPFWRARMYDVDSISTSQNSSNFDFNSMPESSNLYEQQACEQRNVRASSPARRMLCSDIRVLPEHKELSLFEPDLQKTKALPNVITGTSIECINDLKKGGAEQYVSISENEGVPDTISAGECKHTQGPYQQHHDLAASDGRSIFASILANNRQSMLWSHTSFKRDLNMLSPQEEDYLFQNSDLLASFEVQDYVKNRDAKDMAFTEEGLPEDACEDNEGKPLPEQSNFSMNEEVISEFGDDNCKRVLEKLEMGHFNDARRSCSSNDSEESQQKLNNFSNERILWEQKKLAEMSNFNAFKESETQRLKRERAKLEKQTKLLAQLPSKKERNEIEELKAKIANLISEHTKKDSLQNLTINRLRRTITDLTEQIEALQEEVRRYERFLHSELDSNEDSRRKVNMQRVSATDKEHDHEKQKTASSWNRVSTTMHWTRA